MRGICLILLIVVACTALSDEYEKLRAKVNASKKLFEIGSGELELLNEMNTVRRYIASGSFADVFKEMASLVWELGKAVFKSLTGLTVDLVLALGHGLYDVGEMALDWGESLFDSDGAINGLANQVTGWANDAGQQGIQFAEDVGKKALSFFSFGKKKRGIGNVLNYAKDKLIESLEIFTRPENVFGPAKNMNMLTWNRRLAQLAMARKEEIESNKTMIDIDYEGKKYRITRYGTLATYFIKHVLGETICRLFTCMRIGYLAMKMWLERTEIPTINELQTINQPYEIMFADREEVGCFFTWPETICIIGPLKTRCGKLYEAGEQCTGCKYGCTNSLCNPPPSYFYALRDKYKKQLRPQIEKFEIVEGFDGGQQEIGHNFMLDDYAPYSNVFMIVTIMVSLFFLLSNNF